APSPAPRLCKGFALEATRTRAACCLLLAACCLLLRQRSFHPATLGRQAASSEQHCGCGDGVARLPLATRRLAFHKQQCGAREAPLHCGRAPGTLRSPGEQCTAAGHSVLVSSDAFLAGRRDRRVSRTLSMPLKLRRRGKRLPWK